ncbi:hypothetical protein [Staphylococcus gallinarum]|uniref:hypothetical protein n=1 Tax=Staphylococcus gallinarum TaxID=1293 RepID=UPI003F549084
MGREVQFEYVMYKGDEIICAGSREECATMLGIKPDSITYLAGAQNRNNAIKYPNRIVAEKVSIAEIEKELAL